MKLTELSTLIANIPDINADETIKLKDNLVLNYQASVKKSLNEILESQDNDEQKYSALESFLEENWELIKGSLLSYTSIYNTEITKALCKAAESICDFKNSKLEAKSEPFVPLQFLMPGIELFSLIPHYNDLEPVELLKSNSEDQQQLSRLEPGLLKDEKDKLEREKSLFDAQQEHIRQNRFIVKEDYCIPNIPLEIILKTFVLNEDSSSLIPVSVILEDLNLRPYDFSCVVFDEQIKKRTNQRIISHSNETLAIYNAMNKLSIAESDQNHFLGNLTELCKQLKFNDSHSGIGRDDNAGKGAYPAIIAFKEYYDGLEYQLKQWQDEHEIQEGFIYIKFYNNPTEGFTYAVKSKDTSIKQGIIKQEEIDSLFSKDSNENDKNTGKDNSRFYFEKAKNYKEKILKIIISQGNASLEDEAKSKLPKELKNEIEKLLILASDSSRNQNATANMETCIGSRREALEKLISSPEQKQSLAEITTSNASKANLIKKSHNDLQRTKKALQDSLNKADNYQGIDSLGISVKLLETFKIDFKIQDLNTLLDIIKDLTKDEILSLCQRDENIEQFINPIKNNLENLTNFFLDCSEDNLKALLEVISKKGHITKLFDSAKTLAIVVDCASNNAKTNIILKALKDNLKDIITSGREFANALQYLNESQRGAVYTALKDNFKNIIKSGKELGYALYFLNETQITAVCTELKYIIKSRRDFGLALKHLKEPQIIVVCTELKDIIKSGDDFKDALKYLNDTQRDAVYIALKDNLKNIIKSGDDFDCVLQYLKEAQITSICNSLKDSLKNIITSGYDFGYAIISLNQAQRGAVCTALKGNLKNIIKSERELSYFLQYLNETQKDAVCSELKETLKEDNSNSNSLSVPQLKPKRR